MSCPCDETHVATTPDIAPGLDDLPRQLFGFTDLRAAMLDRARLQAALAAWQARASDDYGVMWLEMMAYLGELLSLYDKAIADESYVRTAKLRPSLRRLLALLGYVPRPAVAATIELAAIAGGAQPVTLPAGTGFRSGGFDGEPPQVFELVAPATIHPALNRWKVVVPASPTLVGSVSTLLLDPTTARVAIGDVVLVELSSADADAFIRKVTAVKRVVDHAGRRVVEVTLDQPVDCGTGRAVSGVRLRKPTRTASLKSPSALGADPASFEAGADYDFILDGVYREAKLGERFLVTFQGETRWGTLHTREDGQYTLVPASSSPPITIEVPGHDVTIPSATVAIPAAPVTVSPVTTMIPATTAIVPAHDLTAIIHPQFLRSNTTVPVPPLPPITFAFDTPINVGIPSQNLSLPSNTITVPGQTVTVPGASITIPSHTVTTPDGDATVPGVPIAAVTSLHTHLATADDLDGADRKAAPTSLTWATDGPEPDGFTVGLGLLSSGRVLGAALRSVLPPDPLDLIDARAPIGSTAATTRLILRDVEERGVAVSGGVSFTSGAITLDPDATWTPGLATPLIAFGNVVTAVRGESVAGEVLGSGDATRTMQQFTLAKKPLTYVAVAGGDDADGVAASLAVWVDGLLWSEATSFFGQGPDAQVYVVRQDDDGASTITFGDGVRGARLSTGAGNVVASYRWGAGAASPPAGSIAQIARPVAGLASVVGPIAAGGGADAEDADSLRTLAPRSALLLGRAISIEDMEVAARLAPGVLTARADWAWAGVRQRPVVQVWVVAGPGVVDTVKERLLALTDPDTPIDVAEATPIAATLAIDLELDPRQVPETVLAGVTAALLGEDGWLLPAQLGIDRPLLRSRLLADLLSIAGVTGVRGLLWNGAPLLGYGVEPGMGAYFDLAAGAAVTGS